MLNTRLQNKYENLLKLKKTSLGYPPNNNIHYHDLAPFLDMCLNNCGDPFAKESNYQLNTHDLECEVIDYFAKLYQQPKNYWGYVSSGGTEGNILGVHLGLAHYPNGIVYYNQASHYSVRKAITLTRAKGVEVAAQEKGEMDYAALTQALKQHAHLPAIIVANIGTVMTGAIDDIFAIKTCLAEAGIQDYYLHCDGALHGAILPFQDSPKKFTLADIDSLTVSGYKLIGAPFPCGIFLCQQQALKNFHEHVEYIYNSDPTLTGSRNGFTVLVFWKKFFHDNNLPEIVASNIEKADYAIKKFKAAGIQAWRHDHSHIVVFPKPNQAIVKKWALATQGDIAHIITGAHVDKKMLDDFIAEVAAQ